MGFEFGADPKQAGKKKPKTGLQMTAAADPLAEVEYTDDLQQDAAAELDAVQQAFRDRRDQEKKRFEQATDSEFWFAVCFKTRAHKDAFLAALNAQRLGDKYLDGHALARLLDIDLPD